MENFSSPLAQPFDYPEGEHGILLIHGFTGSPSHMRKIGDALHERGFAVRGILLPGHGTKPEDMLNASWQDYLQAARTAAQEMRKQYAHFTVAGLSMGGVLALMLAEEMNLTACVAIAAPMNTTNRFRHFALIGSYFYPMVHKRADGARATLDAAYDIGYDGFPTRSTHDLNVLMHRAKTNLSLIRCPLLAVQSRQDKTVTADSPDIILNGISSRKKAMLWLQDAPHVCTISPEYMRIVDAMDAFLRQAENE